MLISDSAEVLRIKGPDNFISRAAFLGGATGVTLSFEYRRVGFDSADQYASVEILPPGASFWTELDRFAGPANDADFLAVSYPVTAFAAEDTAVRFVTSPAMDSGSVFIVDNVEIDYTPGGSETVADWPTVIDAFTAQAYDNEDGTTSWAGDWVEGGDDGSPVTGQVYVQSNAAGSLRISQKSNSAARSVDLSSASFATLTFDYKRVALDKAADYVALEISSDGGASWTELDRFAGPDNDSLFQTARYFITPFLASDTTIRFRSSPTSMNNSDRVYFDNVKVLSFVP